MASLETIDKFAKLIYDITKNDMNVNLAAAGFEGTGKSCFMTKLQIAYSKIAGLDWSFEKNCTWERDELVKWIDGKSKDDKKGRVPEHTALCPDELIPMFYKRNWNEEGQKGAIQLLNMCRDRHLFIAGAIPDYWDLDGAVLKRFRFFVYIKDRGVAWVFKQEKNPFTSDPWNQRYNEKIFRKHKNPYGSPNFAFEIRFDDWTQKQKSAYYKVRNEKRRLSYTRKSEDAPKLTKLKNQRNQIIKHVVNEDVLAPKDVADIVNMTPDAIRKISRGDRGKRQ